LYFQSVTDGINNYSILPTVLLYGKEKKRTRTIGCINKVNGKAIKEKGCHVYMKR